MGAFGRLSVFAAAGVVGLVGGAAAQPTAASVRIADWLFVPVVNASGPACNDVLALRDPGEVWGENLSAVWYHRAGGTWNASTWDGPTQDQAIAWVEGQLGLAAGAIATVGWNSSVVLEASSPGVAEAVPVPYYRGVEAADPIAPLVADEAVREELLSTLVTIGYPAASVVTDSVTELCDGTAIIDGIAETAVTAPTNPQGAVSTMVAQCSFCIPWTWYIVTPWSDWSCGPWAHVSGPTQYMLCSARCTYQRTNSRTRTRLSFTRHADCTVDSALQGQTESGIQTGECIFSVASLNCDPSLATCPEGPCNSDSAICGKPETTTTTPWGS